MKAVFLSILPLALLLFAFSSCTKTDTSKPSACFSIGSPTAEVGAIVTFTDCSNHADNLYLDFGDGSFEQSGAVVTHIYAATGIYNVTQTAENGTDRSTIMHTIEILPNRSGSYSGNDTTFTYPVHNVTNSSSNTNVVVLVNGTTVTLTSGNPAYNFSSGVLTGDSIKLDETRAGLRYEGAGVLTSNGGQKQLDINLRRWNNNAITDTYHFHGTK